MDVFFQFKIEIVAHHCLQETRDTDHFNNSFITFFVPLILDDFEEMSFSWLPFYLNNLGPAIRLIP